MKHVKTLNVLLMAGLLSVTACNNADNSKTTSTVDSAVATVDTAAKDIKQDAQAAMNQNEDSNFVVKAAITNMAELKVLQAGLDKGTNKELKMHAKMMIADHKKLGDKVKAYAATKNYTLPADDGGKGDDVIASLGNTKGADWDKAWVNHMVSAHEDCISMFEKGQNDVKDADLKTIIAGALPTLHSHLDMMKALQDKMGK